MDNHLLETHKEGSDAFRANDYKTARACFNKLLEHGLKFADVHNMLGVIDYSNGDYASAVENLKKAIELNPSYTEARLNLSIVLNDTGEYPDAAKAFEQARAVAYPGAGKVDPFIKGRLANLHAQLGDLYHGMGLYDDAMKEYSVALALREDFPDVRTNLGVLYRDMGLHDQAIEEFRRVRQTHPHYNEATIQLGISHYGLDDKATAKELWGGVLRDNPDDAKAMMYYRLVKEE
jgi:tetratricopeptide (TPR) repeat protein